MLHYFEAHVIFKRKKKTQDLTKTSAVYHIFVKIKILKGNYSFISSFTKKYKKQYIYVNLYINKVFVVELYCQKICKWYFFLQEGMI